MKLLITIALLAGSVAADFDWTNIAPGHIEDPIQNTSKAVPFEGRITNGDIAKSKQFPYQVGLLLYKGLITVWCGGTLISNRWIVTAAHCIENIAGVDVYLGAMNRTDRTEAAQQIIYLSTRYAFVHEQWDSKKLINDIGLLKLPVPISFNDYVRPAKLPRLGDSTTYADEKAIASGWGLEMDGATGISDILRWIEVPIMDNTVCDFYYTIDVISSHICIDTQGKKSTCSSDSGGPLVLADGSETLIGLTSFGVSYGCEVEYPAVFTRITSYLDWIKEKTGIFNE